VSLIRGLHEATDRAIAGKPRWDTHGTTVAQGCAWRAASPMRSTITFACLGVLVATASSVVACGAGPSRGVPLADGGDDGGGDDASSASPASGEAGVDASGASPDAAGASSTDAGTELPDTGGDDASIPGYTLVFDDEFENPGPGFDPSKNWSVYSGPQGNAPDFSHFAPQNAYVENGVAVLQIQHQTTDGDPYSCGGFENDKNTYTFGMWVVRARFPQGVGNVGYMGLFGATDSAEIDFGEVAGKSPLENSFTQHYGSGQSDQFTDSSTDWTAGFHVFTVIWDSPGTFTWLVDGVQQYQDTQRTPTENLVVAFGDWAAPCTIAWAGCPTASTAYPATMYIDYVRIYQKQ
jgi:hypothetical protein